MKNLNVNKTITIPQQTYDVLIRDQNEYRALQAAGVDNWEGYHKVMWPELEDEEREVVSKTMEEEENANNKNSNT